ncbi:MAG: hypothetical protein EB103_03520 [Actinobacteria bacterium]|nr:hypothetical protein [Actinomycetota bacterium]
MRLRKGIRRALSIRSGTSMTHDPGMYPRRLLIAEARRLGVKLLPIDINKSSNEFHVEKTSDGTAIRMSFVDLKSISETEINRFIEHQPYSSLTDFYLRGKPSRRTFERLALIGAFDELAKGSTRGDILERVKELNAIKVRPDSENDLFAYGNEPMPKGNPELLTAMSRCLKVIRNQVMQRR